MAENMKMLGFTRLFDMLHRVKNPLTARLTADRRGTASAARAGYGGLGVPRRDGCVLVRRPPPLCVGQEESWCVVSVGVWWKIGFVGGEE